MLCFFFFQAEDGIRDRTVTGVQTCALPILAKSSCNSAAIPNPEWVATRSNQSSGVPASSFRRTASPSTSKGTCLSPSRSEERRVGKECRYRWSRVYEKKRKKNDKDQVVQQR